MFPISLSSRNDNPCERSHCSSIESDVPPKNKLFFSLLTASAIAAGMSSNTVMGGSEITSVFLHWHIKILSVNRSHFFFLSLRIILFGQIFLAFTFFYLNWPLSVFHFHRKNVSITVKYSKLSCQKKFSCNYSWFFLYFNLKYFHVPVCWFRTAMKQLLFEHFRCVWQSLISGI